MRDTKQEIYSFWFEEIEPQQWFQYHPAFAAKLEDRFRLTYDMAQDGLSNHWANDAAGALSLVLVLDQFPRHLFFGTARAYETEEHAAMVAKQSISKGYDLLLPHEQRFFMYIALEHSEQPFDQKRSLELFREMRDENPLAYNVAQQKYEIFSRFGRFPERNAAMGRESTPEEKAYLSEKGIDIRITY